jgi:hypothetical protein
LQWALSLSSSQSISTLPYRREFVSFGDTRVQDIATMSLSLSRSIRFPSGTSGVVSKIAGGDDALF